MTLGEKLISYRKAQGLSQRAFAEKSGISNGTISNIEKGTDRHGEKYLTTLSTANAIAKGMGISLQELLNEVDDELTISGSENEIKIKNQRAIEILNQVDELTPEQQNSVLNIFDSIINEIKNRDK